MGRRASSITTTFVADRTTNAIPANISEIPDIGSYPNPFLDGFLNGHLNVLRDAASHADLIRDSTPGTRPRIVDVPSGARRKCRLQVTRLYGEVERENPRNISPPIAQASAVARRRLRSANCFCISPVAGPHEGSATVVPRVLLRILFGRTKQHECAGAMRGNGQRTTSFPNPLKTCRCCVLSRRPP